MKRFHRSKSFLVPRKRTLKKFIEEEEDEREEYLGQPDDKAQPQSE